MPSFWLLSLLTLEVDLGGENKISQTFEAQSGDLIRLEYEQKDIIFESASKKVKKIRVGYRVKMTIETFVWNSITKADFLRMCMNAEKAQIYSTNPSLGLEDKYLIFKNIEVVEMYSQDKYLLRAEAELEELLPNIPALL